MDNFKKKFRICILLMTIAFISTGCGSQEQSSFAKVESAFGSLMKDKKTEQASVRRVNNVIYMGNTKSNKDSSEFKELSFEFEDLRR